MTNIKSQAMRVRAIPHYGNPFLELVQEQYMGRPSVNLKTGGAVFKYKMAFAFPKTTPIWWDEPALQFIIQAGAEGGTHPSRNNKAAAGGQRGSWGVIDGDALSKDRSGRPNLDKSGNPYPPRHPGHWIIQTEYQTKNSAPCTLRHIDMSELKDAAMALKAGWKIGDYYVAQFSASSVPGNPPNFYVQLAGLRLMEVGDALSGGGVALSSAEELMLPGETGGSMPPSSQAAAAASPPPPPPAEPAWVFVPPPSHPTATQAGMMAAGWSEAQLRASGYLVLNDTIPH